jgi:hypothetical protein
MPCFEQCGFSKVMARLFKVSFFPECPFAQLLNDCSSQARNYGFVPERNFSLAELPQNVCEGIFMCAVSLIIVAAGAVTIDDKTISRKHLTVEIASVGPADCVNTNAQEHLILA